MDIKDVKRVTIAGCGTEGSQIASMVAYKGFETTVWLRSEGSIERARPRLASVKKQIVGVLEAWKADPSAYCRGLSDERGLTPEQIDELIAQAEERLPKIHLTTSLEEAFGEADVVIECINEDPAQKTDLYEKIAPVMPEHTVLLTDSSTFLPSTFADATGRPDRYLTLHFANQIWHNNLTELMRHDRTSDESFALAEQFSHAIGMIPLKLNKEQPGYILNTLLIPWFRAALQLVATGVSDPADRRPVLGARHGRHEGPDAVPVSSTRWACRWPCTSWACSPAPTTPPPSTARLWRCSRATWRPARPASPWARASTAMTRTAT